MELLSKLTDFEKVTVLNEMLDKGEIDELDLFAILCVLIFGFYCDLGKEEFASKYNLTEFLDKFKEVNERIHKFSIDELVLMLLEKEKEGKV